MKLCLSCGSHAVHLTLGRFGFFVLCCDKCGSNNVELPPARDGVHHYTPSSEHPGASCIVCEDEAHNRRPTTRCDRAPGAHAFERRYDPLGAAYCAICGSSEAVCPVRQGLTPTPHNFNPLPATLTKDTPAMSTPIPFTLTNESITVVINGSPKTVHTGTPQYHALRAAIFNENWDAIPTLVSRMGALQQWLGDKFAVVGDKIFYDNVELPDSLIARIWDMASAGESPGPLFAFYERLHKNPSFRSRTQLFNFLRHSGIPIEPDGTFLAYKGVKHDYTDQHTGTVDNSPGARNVMPRNLISDDPDVACHFGFHVGSLRYAATFSQRTVVCRVDPEHVVCVPNDYDSQKMRVCDYTVIGNHGVGNEAANEPLPSTTFAPDIDEDDDEEWGGEIEGDDMDGESVFAEGDEQTDRGEKSAPVVVTAKPAYVWTQTGWEPTKPKAAKFNRMNPARLMEQSIDDLRKYAGSHLKIVGASKLPGGKSALVSKILKVRARRKR